MPYQARSVPAGLLVLTLLLAACQTELPAASPSATRTLLPYDTPTPSATVPVPQPIQGTLPALGPTPTPFVHIIQQGETMLGIALRYGVSLEDLLLINPGVDPGFLTIGAQLRIPGEGGEAVDSLLPSPTPVPMLVSAVRCFDLPTGRMVCLVGVENQTGGNIEGLSVVIKLFDSSGDLLDASLADSALDLLPDGMELPLSSAFSSRPEDFSYASAEVNSAIALSGDQLSSVPLEYELDSRVLDAASGYARLVGSVHIPDGLELGAVVVRVVGVARAANHQLIGYNVWESQPLEAGAVDVPFTLDVFSLGPELASFELYAQARAAR